MNVSLLRLRLGDEQPAAAGLVYKVYEQGK